MKQTKFLLPMSIKFLILLFVGSDQQMHYGNNPYQYSNVNPYDGAIYVAQPYAGICYYDNRNYSNMLDEPLLKDYIRRQM